LSDVVHAVSLGENEKIIHVQEKYYSYVFVDEDAWFIWAMIKSQTFEERNEFVEP